MPLPVAGRKVSLRRAASGMARSGKALALALTARPGATGTGRHAGWHSGYTLARRTLALAHMKVMVEVSLPESRLLLVLSTVLHYRARRPSGYPSKGAVTTLAYTHTGRSNDSGSTTHTKAMEKVTHSFNSNNSTSRELGITCSRRSCRSLALAVLLVLVVVLDSAHSHSGFKFKLAVTRTPLRTPDPLSFSDSASCHW